MADTQRPYLPAAGHDWALPLYDPIVALMGANRARRRLIEQSGIGPGHHILDIGCGTGTLVLAVKRQYPAAHVVGLDPDPNVLSRARAKAARTGLEVRFDAGYADALPYPGRSFDRVLSSFMFHHLSAAQQQAMLAGARRVLKPAGTFHLMDFAMGDRGRFVARLVHSHQHLRENSSDRLVDLLRRAGFADARRTAEATMVFGIVHVGYFGATAPAASGDCTIRRATDADAASVARIWHTGWEDGHLGHVPRELLPFRTPEHFVARTPERIHHTWVAEGGSGVVGFVVVRHDEVEQLFVDRPARGSGVATMLLRKGEDEIRRAGHRRAWLAVVGGNRRARRFYERCGWRDTGAFTYMAETAAGPLAVPSCRYEIDL